MDGSKWWRAAGGMVTVVVAACSTTVPSTAPTTPTVPAPPIADATTTTGAATTIADATTPAAATTTTAAATTISTTAIAAATTTTSTAPTSTVPPTTDAPIPVAIDACPPTGRSIWEQRPPSELAAPTPSEEWVPISIGSSVRGRDLLAWTRPVLDPTHRVLVVGGIHGNEPVSPPSVRGLVIADIPDGVEVTLLPELNPDGVAAGVRCNANGVDLNRNFPWAWRAETGGPAPLSEPETSAVATWIEMNRPDLVVWVHQPYGYVSSIGATSDAYESAWSAGSGLPVRPDVTQHGGGESWTALAAGRSSMLIEIDTWADSEAIVEAQRQGFEALLVALA